MDNNIKCQIPSLEEIKYHIKISLKVYYYRHSSKLKNVIEI